MAFFNLFNAGPSVVNPVYIRVTELPLFTPMIMELIGPGMTVNGDTTKINALLARKYFFYLSASDHAKIVENNGVASLMELVNFNQPPLCSCIKGRTRLGIRYIPNDPEIVNQARNKIMLKRSLLPGVVPDELDFEALNELGIVLEL
ncbi:LOW QUALITY PROTEIN: putative Xaa-Pro aminopeptidase [Frankliniella fusca]|uniref:Xaa-Pro aminopeptidase n=1 Tax=Frankliniella fusca TaxID=407009 RepID=A0AAE1HKK9_9NEOP|nr:LOW QUALITY PROTEIN: putative Xaa-Pro aminopeptidase [Frankliniella fusca]